MLAAWCEARVGKRVTLEDASTLLPLLQNGPAHLNTLEERHQRVLREAAIFSLNPMDRSVAVPATKLLLFADLGPSVAKLVSHHIVCDWTSPFAPSPCAEFSLAFPGYDETLALARRCVDAPPATVDALYHAHVRLHGPIRMHDQEGALEPYVFDYYLVNGVLPVLTRLSDPAAIDALLPTLNIEWLFTHVSDVYLCVDALLSTVCHATAPLANTCTWFFVNLYALMWDAARIDWYRDVPPTIGPNLRRLLGAQPVDEFCRMLATVYHTSRDVDSHVCGVFVLAYKLLPDTGVRAGLMTVLAKFTRDREDPQRVLDDLAQELGVPPRKCLSGATRLAVVLDKIAKMCNEHNRAVADAKHDAPQCSAEDFAEADAEAQERLARTASKRASKKKAREARAKEREEAERAVHAERARAASSGARAAKEREASEAVRRALAHARTQREESGDAATAAAASARVAAALRVHHAQCDAETRALAKAFRATCVVGGGGGGEGGAAAVKKDVTVQDEEDDDDDDLACPITCVRMRDPVLCVGDGHTYERAAIEDWLTRARTSPLTGAPLASTVLVANHAVKRLLSQGQAARA